MIQINTASVRILRSFDYCHFEITLGLLEANAPIGLDEVDGLRKEAARLADKAVEQYKVKKNDLEQHEEDETMVNDFAEEAAAIEKKPETDRTPDEQASLKQFKDAQFRLSRQYDYEDNWEA
jgi:hypothetical protein